MVTASFDYDLFVVGGGSGGVRAARIAAGHGARVAIAEEYRYGGTCVIRGCIPKKLFVYASGFAHHLADARGYGWQIGAAAFDWPTLVSNKNGEIHRLSRLYEHTLAEAGVAIFRGRARLRGQHDIEVGGEGVSARVVLLATGATPFVPAFRGRDLVITSNEAFHLPGLPRTIAIVGGGYVGVEFAHIFAGLGCRTMLIHRRDKVLRGFDEDVRDAVMDGLRAHDVELFLETEPLEVERGSDGLLRAQLADGRQVTSEALMFATGRIPNTAGLGLEALGVELDEGGAVVVDEYSRSSIDHIYAVGDCTDRVALTPVAIREGHAFADTIFGDRPTPVDHHAIPSAIFCQPPAAGVGLSEEEARGAYEKVDIFAAHFRPLKHTLSGREQKTFIKLVVDACTDRILGAHMVGEDAPEIIQCLAIAVKMGATKSQFDRTTALHPTTAEEFVLLGKKTR